jgi:hypothetical protein
MCGIFLRGEYGPGEYHTHGGHKSKRSGYSSFRTFAGPGIFANAGQRDRKTPYMTPRPKTPEIAKFNAHNLLNGQFPPPDSGAGYLFSYIAMNNEFI